MQKRIARTACRWMEHECETDFQFLSRFGDFGVKRFLAWMQRVEKAQQVEAALSITCRKLQMRRIKCKAIPNSERWNERYRSFPLNAGLDIEWRPRRYTKKIASLLRSHLAPIRMLGTKTIVLPDDHPLAIPQVRTGFELSTNLADLALLQSIGPGSGAFYVSYVSLLGVGGTGWKIHKAEDCQKVIAQLPEVIAKVREVVAEK